MVTLHVAENSPSLAYSPRRSYNGPKQQQFQTQESGGQL